MKFAMTIEIQLFKAMKYVVLYIVGIIIFAQTHPAVKISVCLSTEKIAITPLHRIFNFEKNLSQNGMYS